MIELTDEQSRLLTEAVYWFRNSSDQVFQYSAPAGAGKSFMMHRIIEGCGLDESEVAPMAYTGTASLVMRANGFTFAKTICSSIYKLVVEDEDDDDEAIFRSDYSEEDENRILRRKRRRHHKKYKMVWKGVSPGIRLICIDEGSMVPMEYYHDLIRCGVKILVCGDLNQLPPINDTSAFLRSGKIFRLTKIMRQSEGSAIVHISNLLKERRIPEFGSYGNDVLVLPKSQITDQMLIQSDAVLCSRKYTKEDIISHMRHDILHISGYLPSKGERVICRYNNWDLSAGGINLTNGLLCEVVSNPNISSMRSKGIFKMDVNPFMFPTVVFKNVKCDSRYMNSGVRTREAMTHPGSYEFRPIHRFGNKFEFGYAVTIHSSQGSQYNQGMCIVEKLGCSEEDQFRLAYTAITRFRRRCIFVLDFGLTRGFFMVPNLNSAGIPSVQKIQTPKPQPIPQPPKKKAVMEIDGKPIL